MIKCYTCIMNEYNEKIKWSQVQEAVCIYNGISYCFNHLLEEIGKDKKQTSEEKQDEN